jgi:pSer/pThr/pTyr-binding forkhead associated (FHA) protein
MPVLTILNGSREGAEVSFDGDEIFIGNGKDESCTVAMADAGVSRRHARIARKGDGWMIEDIGSSNGTFVNFKKRAQGEQTDLADKDILFIGRTVVKFWATAPAGGGGGGALSGAELRDLLRGTVPIKGVTCPSCNASLEADLAAKAREAEQVEVARRLHLHEMDQGTVDRLIAAAKR